MHVFRLFSVCIIFVFSITASVAAPDAVTIATNIPFSEGSGASSKVKAECQLESKLPQFIESYAGSSVDIAMTADSLEDMEGRVLFIEFTQILGAGGGAWSGPKSVTVRGELRENGEITGSFIASRYSTGGMFGGYKGTCSILGRCVKTLGRDIASWLRSPTIDARLGDSG